MKAKAGSGNFMKTNRLQTLQSEVSSLKREYLQDISSSPYEKSWDSRVWSGKVDIGAQEFEHPDVLMQKARLESLKFFDVSEQCFKKWSEIPTSDSYPGNICICGHPNTSHIDGGLCVAGQNICYCRQPRDVIWVSDTRHFYRATKGPHQAHALELGIVNLTGGGGTFSRIVEWKCQSKDCVSSTRVGPVRKRGSGELSLGLSVTDNHKFMCERCLFIRLNGGFDVTQTQ